MIRRERMQKTVARARFVGLASLLVLVSSCTLLDPDVSVPKRARILVSGSGGNLELVVSTAFTVAAGEAGGRVATIQEADTIYVDPATGYDQIHQIAPATRILIRLSNPEPDPVVVTFKIWLDGDLEYHQEDRTLTTDRIEFSRIYSDWNS